MFKCTRCNRTFTNQGGLTKHSKCCERDAALATAKNATPSVTPKPAFSTSSSTSSSTSTTSNTASSQPQSSGTNKSSPYTLPAGIKFSDTVNASNQGLPRINMSDLSMAAKNAMNEGPATLDSLMERLKIMERKMDELLKVNELILNNKISYIVVNNIVDGPNGPQIVSSQESLRIEQSSTNSSTNSTTNSTAKSSASGSTSTSSNNRSDNSTKSSSRLLDDLKLFDDDDDDLANTMKDL